MNSKILTVSLIGALAVAVAPVARADGNTQAFVDEMYAVGVTPSLGTESFWVMSAMRQCHAMDQGVPPEEIAETISQANPDLGIDLSATIVVLAIKHFCPAHMPPEVLEAEAEVGADQFA